ncbi:hypothetical protein ACVLVH_000929 [Kluyvera sp. 1366]|jgi:hypothetical protein
MTTRTPAGADTSAASRAVLAPLARCLRLPRRANGPFADRPSWPTPNCLTHPCVRLLAQRKSLSAANSPFAAADVPAPLKIEPFSTTCTEAKKQAGATFGQAIRSAERSEEARRARRTRAKGGAGTWKSRLRRSVRQTNEVKEPRKRREDRRTKSGPGLRKHRWLNRQALRDLF